MTNQLNSFDAVCIHRDDDVIWGTFTIKIAERDSVNVCVREIETICLRELVGVCVS